MATLVINTNIDNYFIAVLTYSNRFCAYISTNNGSNSSTWASNYITCPINISRMLEVYVHEHAPNTNVFTIEMADFMSFIQSLHRTNPSLCNELCLRLCVLYNMILAHKRNGG